MCCGDLLWVRRQLKLTFSHSLFLLFTYLCVILFQVFHLAHVKCMNCLLQPNFWTYVKNYRKIQVEKIACRVSGGFEFSSADLFHFCFTFWCVFKKNTFGIACITDAAKLWLIYLGSSLFNWRAFLTGFIHFIMKSIGLIFVFVFSAL